MSTEKESGKVHASGPSVDPVTHIALIRGINVGGKNTVTMADLREYLDARGLGPVETYIQSGNVLLRAGNRAPAEVSDVVRTVLREHFDVDTVVVTLNAETLRHAVDGAPGGFGAEPDRLKYDVVFLRPGLSPSRALAAVETKDGIDTAIAGDGVVYFTRLTARIGSSYLPKLVSKPEYQDMTIRNWRTTTTLARMVSAANRR